MMNEKITNDKTASYALCEIPKTLADQVESFYIVPLRAKREEGTEHCVEDKNLKQKLNISIIRDHDYLIGIIVPKRDKNSCFSRPQQRSAASANVHSPMIDGSSSDSNISTVSSSSTSTTLSANVVRTHQPIRPVPELKTVNNNQPMKEPLKPVEVSVSLKRKSPEQGSQPNKKVSFEGPSSNQTTPSVAINLSTTYKKDENTKTNELSKQTSAENSNQLKTGSASNEKKSTVVEDDWDEDDVFDPYNNKDYEKYAARPYEKRVPQITNSSSSSVSRDPRLARLNSQQVNSNSAENRSSSTSTASNSAAPTENRPASVSTTSNVASSKSKETETAKKIEQSTSSSSSTTKNDPKPYSRSKIVYIDEAKVRQKRADKEVADLLAAEKRDAEQLIAKHKAEILATKINSSVKPSSASEAPAKDESDTATVTKSYRGSLLPKTFKISASSSSKSNKKEPNTAIIENILNSILTDVKKTDTSPKSSSSTEGNKSPSEDKERTVAVTDGKAVKPPPTKTQRHIHVPKSAPLMPTKLLASSTQVTKPPAVSSSTASLSTQSNLSVTINNARPATPFDVIWKMLENLLVNKFLRTTTGMRAIATKPEIKLLTELNWSRLYAQFGKDLSEFFLIASENGNAAATAVIQAVKDMERILKDQSLLTLNAIKSEVESEPARIKRSASMEDGEITPPEKKTMIKGKACLEDGELSPIRTTGRGFICEVDLVSDTSEE